MKKKIAWLLIVSMLMAMFLPLAPSYAAVVKSLPNVRKVHPGIIGPYYGPKAESNNPFKPHEITQGNCTWYAFGRVSELLGDGWKNNLARRGDAKDWFENNKHKGAYELGTDPAKPRLGAIACWSGGTYGHVAVVEEIYEDGSIGISESNYPEPKDLPNFEYNRVPTGNRGKLVFQGYIYVFPENHFQPKESDPDIQEGEYQIVSNYGNGVVEVDPNNSDNGANVRLGMEFNGGEHQKWRLEKNGDGTFLVISASTGKVLDVEGGFTSDNANIHVWNYEGLDNQKWYILKSNSGWYNFIAKHSGMAMDVSYGKDNIQQFSRNYTPAQDFKLMPFGSVPNPNPSPNPSPNPNDEIRDVVLTLDVSGSMSGDKIENTKKAAARFVEMLLSKSANMKIGIVTYDDSVQVVSELTNDKQALLSAINSLSDGGGTNIYGGLEAAGDLLSKGNANKKAVVIMTDGQANEGKTETPETINTEDGAFPFNGYETAIYHLAEEYKNQRGYDIYSLGFGLSENSSAYRLIKYIASVFSGKRAFWSITNENVGKIVFDFEDIADSIGEKDRILIQIHCPVDVQITKNGETLDKNLLTSSFGRANVSKAKDGHQYLFSLDYATDYRISIQGTGDGVMNFNLTYKVGGRDDSRSFVGIPITGTTRIHTDSTDLLQDLVLFEDRNGDGVIDQKWVAGANAVIKTPLAYEEERLQYFYHPYFYDFSPSNLHSEKHTLTFETNGGTYLPSIHKAKGRDQEKLDLSGYVPTKQGFVFDGWYSNADLTTKITSVTFEENTIVYAKWNPIDQPETRPVTRPAVEPITYIAPSIPFADVKNGDWFKDGVEYVWKKGIMSGLSSSTFGAYDSTTRAMIVTILWRMEGEPTSIQSVAFQDVSENSYYITAIKWAVEKGIIKGYNEKKFGSDDYITMEQMTAIIHRYAKMKGLNTESGYGMENGGRFRVSPYALSSIQWAVSNDLLKGVDGDILVGSVKANRAQIAAFLHKLSFL